MSVDRVYQHGEREAVAIVPQEEEPVRRPPVPCVRCGTPTTSDLGVMLYSPLCTDCQCEFLHDAEDEPEEDLDDGA